MNRLYKQFFDICLFQSGPQDLPGSRPLVAFSMSVYIAVTLLLWQVVEPVTTSVLVAVTDTALMVLLANVALQMRGYPTRNLQTITALTGTGALLTFIAWPLQIWLHRASETGVDASIPAVLWLLLLIWSIAVIGHILRHALSVPLAAGIGLSFLYAVISYHVIQFLFYPGG